jgi:hypothetical protein
MPITTLHEETSIDALVDGIFPGIAPDERDKVMAALIKANPQIEGLDRLDAGTVLMIPNVPGVGMEPAAGPWGFEDPTGEGSDLIARALQDYGARIAERHELYRDQLQQQAALLKDRELKKALRERPDAEQLVPDIEAAIKTRTREAAKQHNQLQDALTKLAETLGSL